MRRYRVEVGGTTYVVDVNELSSEQYQVRVGDREFTVNLSAPEDVVEAAVSPGLTPRVPGAPSAAPFHPAPPETLRSMVPAAPPPLPPSPERGGDTTRAVKAPMPGTITSVEVSAGAEVRVGDVLLRLEAMKMVNAIKSPRRGVIADVLVQQGQSVGYGAVLVLFRED